MINIPFNKPFFTGNEIRYIELAYQCGYLAGDGIHSKKCQKIINSIFEVKDSLLTHSCTAALEMAAILCDIGPGDEVIMPSYTFVSTANAFVLRGAVPVFVDIKSDTLNLDEELTAKAITKNTRAIIPVHYAGVACNMSQLVQIADEYGIYLIEDAAQGICSKYKNIPLGSFGDLATVSFHETKNIMSGEGGALLINNERLKERAEIIREKGTNRSQFFKGLVDKYTWVDIGSSFLPGELTASFLLAQLEMAYSITERRLKIWAKYHQELEELSACNRFRRPVIPNYAQHNAHMYYLILNSEHERDEFIRFMKDKGISCVFHYQPLHSTQFGIKVGKSYQTDLAVTSQISKRLVRLPFWIGIEEHQEYIIKHIKNFFRH